MCSQVGLCLPLVPSIGMHSPDLDLAWTRDPLAQAPDGAESVSGALELLKFDEGRQAPQGLVEALEVQFATGESTELHDELESAGTVPTRRLIERIKKCGRTKCLDCNLMYENMDRHLDSYPEHRKGTVAKEKQHEQDFIDHLVVVHPELAKGIRNLKTFRASGHLTTEERNNVDILMNRTSHRRKRSEMHVA